MSFGALATARGATLRVEGGIATGILRPLNLQQAELTCAMRSGSRPPDDVLIVRE
jgi:hypothetical protein